MAKLSALLALYPVRQTLILPEQTVEQTVQLLVTGDALVPIWRHCNDTCTAISNGLVPTYLIRLCLVPIQHQEDEKIILLLLRHDTVGKYNYIICLNRGTKYFVLEGLSGWRYTILRTQRIVWMRVHNTSYSKDCLDEGTSNLTSRLNQCTLYLVIVTGPSVDF